MGTYNKESVLKSKRAYEVLQSLVDLRESYASELANETGMERSMCSEILGLFEKIGLIEVSKREKAKYYKLSPKGIYNVFIDIQGLEWPIEGDSVVIEMSDGFGVSENEEKNLEDLEREFEEEMPVWLTSYVINYSMKIDDSNIEKMLSDDLFETLMMLSTIEMSYLDIEYPAWLKQWLGRKNMQKLIENIKLTEIVTDSMRHYDDIEKDYPKSNS